MSTDQTTTDRSGTCAECRETVAADGEQAGVAGGRLICRDCINAPVAFVAECLDCGWSYRCEERATNRHAAKQRVQQEGNSHEREKQTFEDESHETVWRQVDPERETA
ncbi:hypothetical protein [Halostella litorea]|uniref:hypothetical protein n=1 Tax=Halostella litorea TaxID=2528831 RepID=UPI001093266E|nr:hypothetical protein [Halostella litorea]